MGDPDCGGIQIRDRGMDRLWGIQIVGWIQILGYPECAGIMGVSILGLGTDCGGIQIVGGSRLSWWGIQINMWGIQIMGMDRLWGIQILGVSRLWEHHDCGGIHIIGDMDRLWGILIVGHPDCGGIKIVGLFRLSYGGFQILGVWTEYCGDQGNQIRI